MEFTNWDIIDRSRRSVEVSAREYESKSAEIEREQRVARERFAVQNTTFTKIKEKVKFEKKSDTTNPGAEFQKLKDLQKALKQEHEKLKSLGNKLEEIDARHNEAVQGLLKERKKLERYDALLAARSRIATSRAENGVIEAHTELIVAGKAKHRNMNLLSETEESRVRKTRESDESKSSDDIEKDDGISAAIEPVSDVQLSQQSSSNDNQNSASDARSFQHHHQAPHQPPQDQENRFQQAQTAAQFERTPPALPSDAQVESLKSWEGLGSSGVEFVYVSSSGRKVHLELTSREDVIRVHIAPEQSSDRRVLWAEKQEIEKQLRDAGIKVGEVVVGAARTGEKS